MKPSKLFELTMTHLLKIGYKDSNAILGALLFTVYTIVLPVILLTDIICTIFFPELNADKISIAFLIFLTIMTMIPHIAQLFKKKSK